MARIVYKVEGGWHADDDFYFMACFGLTLEDAECALATARERARLIEQRLALAPQDDEELTAEDLAAIEESHDDLAHGRYRVVKPAC